MRIMNPHLARKTRAAENWQATALAIALASTLAGCGGPAHTYDAVVTGTVTIDGELAHSGTVTFHPVEEGGAISIGRIYPDGSFSLRTGQGDLRESDGGTVPSGDYIVTVLVTGPPPESETPAGGPPPSGPLLVARKYIIRDTSDLRRTVKPGDNIFVFDLEPATAEPGDSGPTEPAPATQPTGEGEATSDSSADGVAVDDATGAPPADRVESSAGHPAAGPGEVPSGESGQDLAPSAGAGERDTPEETSP